MKTPAALSLEQHNVEIQHNREMWSRKPLLQEIYRGFYRRIAAQLALDAKGLTVELGSGMGSIKEVIPHCVTTDLFPNPWLDRQENAYALSFADGSLANLILFDVWHHLRYPGTALRECHRALAPGGRLIIFDPAASWIGRFIYHFFHHEPVGLGQAITWDAPTGFSPADADYFAAQGAATRMFWWAEARAHLTGWRIVDVVPVASFAYFASGGFSGPMLGGRFLHTLMRAFDPIAALAPRIFAARLLVVLEKEKP